ncbi:MAG: HEPN domain-containing protein [bacterium]
MKDRIVKEWFERGKHDFLTAKLIFSQAGYYEEVIFLLHQAVEKYLKGYLIWYGWEPRKIHDIETLLTEIIEFDKGFEKYLDLGRRLTGYYYEERYPPGPIPEILDEEVEDTFKLAEEIINLIKSKVSVGE